MVNPYHAAAGSLPSYTYNETRLDADDLATYTFSACDMGTEASDRLVVVTLFARGGTSLTGITLGGVAMNEVVNRAANNGVSAIFSLAVPTGSTANVVASFGSTMNRCGMSIYSLFGMNSTVYDTQVLTTTNFNVVEDGIVLSVQQANTNSSITDCSIDASGDLESNLYKFLSGQMTSTGTRQLSASGGANTSAVGSWQPL